MLTGHGSRPGVDFETKGPDAAPVGLLSDQRRDDAHVARCCSTATSGARKPGSTVVSLFKTHINSIPSASAWRIPALLPPA